MEKLNVREALGIRLGFLRVGKGLTQADIAKKLKTSANRISDIENGKVQWIDKYITYAKALGYELDLKLSVK